ncbi:sugar kinase [Rhizobium sp. 18065]|uniref:sugar kinase n=1 Tax=Rhizobium sp. 18065 TaxID=2681411 RepID=UPI00135A3AE7|nr:sugar kinase [Rhizobium sp. 18065]
MKRIVSIGECMGELSETDVPGALSMGFAGDTLNTAWYLRRMLPGDWTVDYVTAVGTDGLSNRLVEYLDSERIGTGHIQRLSDKTIGLYYIELKHGERSFTYWRSDSAAKRLASDVATLELALAGASIAYWSGITLAILAPADRQTLIDVLKRFAAQGGKVIFDPNLRPRLWESPDAMREWITRAASIADLCLPSHEDEASWFGDRDAEETARRYRQAGAKRVAVKNGPDEISLLGADGELSNVPVQPAANVVDTTAAGDSFNAGFIAAELAGGTMAQAARAGATLAGRVIGARGALVPQAIEA